MLYDAFIHLRIIGRLGSIVNMKPQDIVFLFFVVMVMYKKSSRIAVIFGSACLLLSIPLFSEWVFFTAERLTWYAVGFFLIAIFLQYRDKKHE